MYTTMKMTNLTKFRHQFDDNKEVKPLCPEVAILGNKPIEAGGYGRSGVFDKNDEFGESE